MTISLKPSLQNARYRVDSKMITDEFPLHLFRLASSILPVGGFSYSRGLESAVDRGWVNDERGAQEWILGMLEHIYATLDGALFVRMTAALASDNRDAFLHNDEWLRASRESQELQLEDLRMGAALQRLLRDLDIPAATGYADRNLSYPAAFALATHHWIIPSMQALQGLMWSVVEGQVTAAMRLVPLGQTSGQRIMVNSVDVIARSAALAGALTDDEIGNTAPALAMASAWHEVQYTRLFRS
jgi:urease accessory protein